MSIKIQSSGKCDVMRVKKSWLFELACLLVCPDHIASLIINANHSVLRAAAKLRVFDRVADCIRDCIRLAVPEATEWQRIGD